MTRSGGSWMPQVVHLLRCAQRPRRIRLLNDPITTPGSAEEAKPRALYAALCARLDEVGDGIEIGKASTYMKFMVVGFNFAELAPRLRGLQVVVHSNGFSLEHGQTSTWEGLHVKRRSSKAANTLDIEIEVDTETNLDSVVKALRDSYETISMRHSRP